MSSSVDCRSHSTRRTASFAVLALAVIILFPLCLVYGSVHIPVADVAHALAGGDTVNPAWRFIVVEMRLPMALAALLAGAALSVAGLLLQTTFDNPLAGPSILGVSTGASLGVGIVMLGCGGAIGGLGQYMGIFAGAVAGAMGVLLLLIFFSAIVRSTVMLLIVGIMVGYLASSVIALLNFFAPQEGVHGFVVWGLGSFSGLTLDSAAVMGAVTLMALFASMFMIKPLNALLLGQRYARSLGVNLRSTRNALLLLSGVLTAVVTAFCGPISFIGLVVPHITRMIVGTSNHNVLLPATALCGAAIALLCTLLSVAPGASGVIPINAITPIIGVPVIIVIIIYRHKLAYFN